MDQIIYYTKLIYYTNSGNIHKPEISFSQNSRIRTFYQNELTKYIRIQMNGHMYTSNLKGHILGICRVTLLFRTQVLKVPCALLQSEGPGCDCCHKGVETFLAMLD